MQQQPGHRPYDDLVRECLADPDELRGYQRAAEIQNEIAQASQDAALVRAQIVARWHHTNRASLRQTADHFQISRGRVQQMIKAAATA